VDPSTRWFVVLALLSLAGLGFGVYLARRTRHRGRVGIVVALLLLGLWAWLLQNPSVAVELVPLDILSWIEGAASVPIFMFIIGIAWVRAGCARQRRLVAWAAVLGGVYFVNGNLWLLQTTPQIGFADMLSDGDVVMQSQDYSCVPAACATAVRLLGVHTTEAEMAALTQTRPGTGSTLLRAMEGLRMKLGRGYRVTLLQPRLQELRDLPTPFLTPLQFEPTRRHMVTVTTVMPFGAWVADPTDGKVFYGWEDLRRHYAGQVLVIEP